MVGRCIQLIDHCSGVISYRDMAVALRIHDKAIKEDLTNFNHSSDGMLHTSGILVTFVE